MIFKDHYGSIVQCIFLLFDMTNLDTPSVSGLRTPLYGFPYYPTKIQLHKEPQLSYFTGTGAEVESHNNTGDNSEHFKALIDGAANIMSTDPEIPSMLADSFFGKTDLKTHRCVKKNLYKSVTPDKK